ncbi:hypothetical protein GF322_04030 [Candidatus Dependentiae bacterium]|nr:hypothetical protein [Candidatus Dependentiae bacterium]
MNKKIVFILSILIFLFVNNYAKDAYINIVNKTQFPVKYKIYKQDKNKNIESVKGEVGLARLSYDSIGFPQALVVHPAKKVIKGDFLDTAKKVVIEIPNAVYISKNGQRTLMRGIKFEKNLNTKMASFASAKTPLRIVVSCRGHGLNNPSEFLCQIGNKVVSKKMRY